MKYTKDINIAGHVFGVTLSFNKNGSYVAKFETMVNYELIEVGTLKFIPHYDLLDAMDDIEVYLRDKYNILECHIKAHELGFTLI